MNPDLDPLGAGYTIIQSKIAIGSGGPYAQAAARALLDHTDFPPADIVKKALTIAGDLCIYTNQSHTIESLD